MTHDEKINIVLKVLYDRRTERRPLFLSKLLNEHRVPYYGEEEIRTLSKGLEQTGYATIIETSSGPYAAITATGIETCERAIAASPQEPASAFYADPLLNSPDSNSVGQSSNTMTNHHQTEIEKLLPKIIEAINNEQAIPENTRKELLQIIEEMYTVIAAGKKPKFTYESLLTRTAYFSAIASLVIQLGQLL